MPFERGTVIIVAAGGGIGHKPRPAIVIQNEDYAFSDTLIIIPLTSQIAGELTVRPVFDPDETNGLREPSRLMTNRISRVPITNIGDPIGRMSPEDMERVDSALALILAL